MDENINYELFCVVMNAYDGVIIYTIAAFIILPMKLNGVLILYVV